MDAVVIGYGNTLRGDDGAGPAVADAVARWGRPDVCAHAVHQLLPEMAAWLANARVVVFVDAAADAAQGKVRVVPLHPTVPASPLAHTGDPGWLLALTLGLYGRCPPAWLVTVPVVDFDYREGLSAESQRGVVDGLRHVAELLTDLR